jgi:hypothetical protein
MYVCVCVCLHIYKYIRFFLSLPSINMHTIFPVVANFFNMHTVFPWKVSVGMSKITYIYTCIHTHTHIHALMTGYGSLGQNDGRDQQFRCGWGQALHNSKHTYTHTFIDTYIDYALRLFSPRRRHIHI